MLYEVITLGVRDYLHKTGFTKAVLGLSGGIDSAVTAVLACTALGPENVLCVAMPSPYTSQHSIDDARDRITSYNVCYTKLLRSRGTASRMQTCWKVGAVLSLMYFFNFFNGSQA